jgi:hypothetical protein
VGRTGRTRSRRRGRRGPSAGGVATRVAAGAAIGLVALSAPATDLAAQVTASWAPFRDAGAAAGTGPARVVGAPRGAAAVPDPVADAPVLALPVPRRMEVELPAPVVPHGVPLETAPPPAQCGGSRGPRQVPPGIVPGAGSATVSWQADGRDVVQGYRVSAVSQQLVSGEQPAPPQVTVGRRDDCGEVTATLGGLTSGVAYVFWLEELVLDADSTVTVYEQVGWSPAVVIG